MNARYRKLEVWQDAFSLAIEVYGLSEEIRENKDFGLLDQLRRSSISVFSNIAEGSECGSDARYRHYLQIAQGSLAEMQSQLEFAQRVYQLPSEEVELCMDKSHRVKAKLRALANYLSKGATSKSR